MAMADGEAPARAVGQMGEDVWERKRYRVSGVDVNDGLLPRVEVKSPRPVNVWFHDTSAASREP
ncbi:hypothetical protein E2562_000851 [Oryza meyeriana var. granulata]|uniref:Uncharacterized protein n=1 Tax=Oryza meyeriana var. granulata TaxID=110450 RepID=A0A6G1CY55_9ORYZ|nr:hypothetical protein E2562_000851 [Oryza meyeriana var. granulata]